MSKYFRSWTYWQFKFFDDITTAANPGTTESFYDNDGNLQETKVKALARPYAYAICGRYIKQSRTTGSYSLNFFPADCGSKHTEIFLN